MNDDTIQITDIADTERIRKEYGDVEGLANSIRRYGVIQPIVVQRLAASCQDAEQPHDTGPKGHVLVAGGRRLAALHSLGQTTLRHGKEFVWRDEDISDPRTALRLQGMELEENLRRSDLTWSETIAAKLKLLRTMQSIHGVSKGYGAGKTAVWDRGFGIRTLADMLGENPGTTSRDIDLAQVIEKQPRLAAYPTRLDAQRQLGVAHTVWDMRKKAAMQQSSAPPVASPQARTVGTSGGNQSSATAIPPVASQAQPQPQWELYEGRFQDNISVITSSSIDLICTDLPYNLGVGTSTAAHAGGLAQFDDTNLDIDSLCCDVAVESYRVLRDNRFAVFFYGMVYHDTLHTALVSAGFSVDPYPFIWLRDRTAPPDGFARYSKTYDPAMVASKGVPRFIRPNLPNSVAIPSVRGSERLHAAQKPVAIMQKFIEDMTIPGCVVLDMFAGVGTTGVAALLTKRRVVLFECEAHNCFIIKSRLGAVKP